MLSMKTTSFIIIIFCGPHGSSASEKSDRQSSLVYDLYPEQELPLQSNLQTKSLQAEDGMDCVFKCIAVQWCKSVNFWVTSLSNGLHVCQLLSSDRFTNKQNMTENKAVNHYSVKNPCEDQPCKNGGGCKFQENREDYTCTCQNGFNGEHCETDVNECTLGSHSCHGDATCTNTVGSYSCKCKSGYQGDGFTCTVSTSCQSDSAVGMQARTLPDSSLTASSEWDANRNPKNGRLNSAYCWGARQSQVGEWMQVDLGQVKKISRMATQGEGGSQYTNTIKIQYSTGGITSSSPYAENGKIFTANTAGNGQINTFAFSPNFDARYIRVYPQTWTGWITLRMELYAC